IFQDIDSLDFLDRHLSEPARHDCAIQLSNLANVFLLVFKLLATFKSGSLVVGASTVDSLLDLIHSTMKRPELYKYPIEKLRSQPVGILAFGCIMATLGTYMAGFFLLFNFQHSRCIYLSIFFVHLFFPLFDCMVRGAHTRGANLGHQRASREDDWKPAHVDVCYHGHCHIDEALLMVLL
ncbi:Metal tolerance protein 3, partial [Linum grandiflorum]